METTQPLWERLSELHGRSKDGFFVVDKPLGDQVPTGILDRHGGLLSTAERLSHAPAFAIDWLADGLSLRQLGHWPNLRTACVNVLRQFLSGKGNAAAWIHFESCRDPITIQAPGLKHLPWDTQWELPHVAGTVGDYAFRSINPTASDISLSRRSLRFLDAEERHATRLVRVARVRSLMGPKGPVFGLFDAWCAADPVDDRACIDAGWIPAGFPLRVANSIYTGLLLDMVSLDAVGNADALTLELHPQTAEIISVRRAQVPLELLFRSHPRYHHCLLMTLGERLETVEFPREIAKLKELIRNPALVRFHLLTSLRVLFLFVETRSLRQAGIQASAGGHSGARKHLRNIEEALGVPLIHTHVNVRGQLNRSEPTPAANELAAWARSLLVGSTTSPE